MMEESTVSEILTSTRKLSSLHHYRNVDADKVLNAYGKFGRYQMFTYFLLNSVTVLFALNMMVMPFIVEKPEFFCELDEDDQSVYTSIDSCTLIDSENKTHKCLDIRKGRYGFNSTPEESLAAEFNLLCDDYTLTEHASSIFLFGGMLAAPLVTQLADRIGRRPAFLFPLYLSVTSNLLATFAPSYFLFLSLRFFAGFGATGFVHIAFVLCTESVSTEFRNLLPALPAVIWVLGYVLSGVLKMFIPNWRWLYFVISAPGLLTIPLFWFIPESLHWLTTKNKHNAVENYIKKANRYNKIQVRVDECRLHEDRQAHKATGPDRTILDIFRHKGLLFQLLLNSIVFIVMNGTYWALSLFSTELSEDKMTGFFLSGIVELPGGLLGTYLLVKFPRKVVAACGFILQGLSMLAAIYLPGSKTFLMFFPLASKVFNSLIWAVVPLVASELAPTTVRNTFTGLVSFVGDLGSVLAPYIKRLEAWDSNAPALLMALASFLGAACMTLIPETKNITMPTDLHELDAGPLRKLFGGKKKAQTDIIPEEHKGKLLQDLRRLGSQEDT